MQRFAILLVTCRLAGFSPAIDQLFDKHGAEIGLPGSQSIRGKGQAIDPNLIVAVDMSTSFINKLPVA